MKKTVIIYLFLIISGILVGLNIQTQEVVSSKAENRQLDQMVFESFSLGCEVGMAIYCDPKNLMECKKKCFTFLNDNPKILNALKKKPEITLEKMKNEKPKSSFLFF